MFSEFLGQCDGKPTSNMYISASKYTEKEEAKVLLEWKHRVAGNCILSFERILVLTSTLMQINLFSNMSWISCFCLDASGMMNILLQLKWHRKHQHYWSGNQTVKKKKTDIFCSVPTHSVSLSVYLISLSFSPAATSSVSIWVQHPLSGRHRCLSISSCSRLADTSHPSCFDPSCCLTLIHILLHFNSSIPKHLVSFSLVYDLFACCYFGPISSIICCRSFGCD